MEEEKKKFHKFLNFILFVIILSLGIVFYSKYVGVKGLIVKEYRIESNILTKNFSGLKIVHFSDLLYKSTVDRDDIKKLINKINTLRPDIIVFTGDLINKNVKITNDDREFIINSLTKMHASIGKYAVYGDYDYSIDNYESIMTKSNFKVLNNSYDEVLYKTDEPLYVVGLPSSIKDIVKINEAFSFYKDEDRRYIICLVHDGQTIKYLDDSNYEVDLILGGHSLNGSVVIPYYGPLFVDKDSGKYYQEEYTKGINKIFISSGIGTNKYSYRFNNKPSINLYRLKAQS